MHQSQSILTNHHQTTLISIYRRDKKNPAASNTIFKKWLDKSLHALAYSSFVIGGDTNAKHPHWGHCTLPNPAGSSIMEAVRSSPSAKILNDGSATRASFLGSTYRFDKPSAIDTTVVSQGPVTFSNWRTHDQSSSDHFVITYDMLIPHSVPQAPKIPTEATRLLSKTLCTRHKAKLQRHLEEEALALDVMGLGITDAVDMLTQAI